MGISVDLYSFDYEALRWEFKKIIFDQRPEIKLTDAGYEKVNQVGEIMKAFGEVIEDRYILLYNEYYEEYNSYCELASFIDRYYGIEDSSDALHSKSVKRKTMVCNQSASDLADKMNIELPEEE